MKKLLLVFAAMLATVGVKADVLAEITFPAPTQDQVSSYATDWTATNDFGTWSFTSFNNNNNVWEYIRCGWKTEATTSTITSPEINGDVTSIVVTVDKTSNVTSAVVTAVKNGTTVATVDCTSSWAAGEVEVTLSAASGSTIILTLNNEKVSSNGTTQISKVTINGTKGESDQPSKPTISGVVEFTESTEVSITAAEGCKIYYSYDESEFVDLNQCSEYTAPFTLTSTTTVYAQAVDAQGKKSDIASKTFTKLNLTQVSSIAAIANIEKGTKVQLTFPMTAIFQMGNNLVVTDSTSSILVYGSTGNTYKNGDVIAAGSIVTVSEYGGNKQLTPNTLAEATEGTALVPTVVTATTLAEQGYLAYVKMENVSLAINNKQITITDAAGNEVAGYNQFGLNLSTLDTEAKFDIVGVYGSYNGNKQLQPTEIISKAPAYEPTGDGTMANPYTVADVKHLCATADAPQDKVWVKGTIAGNVNTSTGELEVPTDTVAAVATNLMLQTGDDMISVQLPAGNVRAALNIKDNLDNIGKEVWVYGTIKEIYCKIAGVKSVTEYSWDGTTTAIRTTNADSQREGKFLQNGKVVIVKNGKTYNTAGRLMIND